MANKTSFKWDAGTLNRNIDELNIKLDRAIHALNEFEATRGMAYMKTNAPWTDRTGAARNGLHTTTDYPRKQYVIVFAHSVSYGIWLEVANSGDYRIIMPSVENIGHEYVRSLSNLMGKIR